MTSSHLAPETGPIASFALLAKLLKKSATWQIFQAAYSIQILTVSKASLIF
jgi:hypothetical protein